MISQTFYNGFERNMKGVCHRGVPITNEEVYFMCGLIKGAFICNHMSVSDIEYFMCAVGEISPLSDYTAYVALLRKIINKEL